MQILEKLKYRDGISLKLFGYKLSLSKNMDKEDIPKLLKKWYKKRTGKELNLENPQNFNEKIQWLKLYDNSPLKTKLADKYLVREWIKEKIGEEYLIPLLGVWDNFDDIDFTQYFSPETVIPMQLSKGCYWGKCTFCDYYYGQQCFDIKKIDAVIDEIKYFIDKYKVKHFLFIDEAIPPKYYNELANAILKNNLEIYFYSFVRLEKGFTREIFDNLYKAGFRIGLWGYESSSERIMQMMNKGIDVDERLRILRDAKEAGIWNNGLFIMGYPTETMEEIQNTISVIYDNRDIIHSCTPSNFSLKKNAILMNFIGKNGLLGYETNGEFYVVLKDKIDGVPQWERREIRRKFHSDYIEANKHCLWPINYSDTDHILLYLSKYTCEYVSGYRSKNDICLQFR